jgi:hypothetical protein
LEIALSLIATIFLKISQRKTALGRGVLLTSVWTSKVRKRSVPQRLDRQYLCLCAKDVYAIEKLAHRRTKPLKVFGLDENGAEIPFDWCGTAKNVGQIYFASKQPDAKVFGIRLYGEIKFEVDVYWLCEPLRTK